MVGREAQMDALLRARDEVVGGRFRVVVIGGEAGIGKSRLVTEFATASLGNMRLAVGACLSMGSSVPYLPFVEMVRGLRRELRAGSLDAAFGPSVDELARIIPGAALPPAAGGQLQRPGEAAGADLSRLAFFEALLRTTERLAAERALCLVIEDLHWADQATLELLAFLVHNLRGQRVLVVLTVRTEALEAADPVLGFLADLERDEAVERVELQPLSAEQTRRQLEAIAGTLQGGSLVERIQALSDGNPFYAEELLATTRDGDASRLELSPKLRDMIRARIARLPSETLHILRLAAAAGRTVNESLLAAAADIEPADLERGLRGALDDYVFVRVIGERGTSYRFRHEILRAAVAEQLLPSEQARLHGAFARALVADPSRRHSPGEIAFHWDAAGETGLALAAHLEAGMAADASFAYGQAADHYERCLALWGEVADAVAVCGSQHWQVAARAADSAARAGRLERAIELVRDVLSTTPAPDPGALASVRSSLRWYLWESGEQEAALMEAREAVVATAAGGPSRWLANALAHLAGLLLVTGETGEARRQATEARRVAREVDALPEETFARGVIGWCLLFEGQTEEGLADLREALAMARRVAIADREAIGAGETGRRYQAGLVFAHTQLAAALELAGRLEEALGVATDGAAIAEAEGTRRTYGSVLQATALRLLYFMGRWQEAELGVEAALEAGAVGPGRIGLLSVRALLAAGRGQYARASEALVEARERVAMGAAQEVRRWVAAAEAETALWQGRPTDALAVISEVVDDGAVVSHAGAMPSGVPDDSLPRLLALAARASADIALVERAGGGGAMLAAVAADQARQALRRVERRTVLAHAWRSDLAIAAAELARGEGDGPRSIRRWKTAVEVTAGTRPYLEAYARWRLAEALFGDRRMRDAAVDKSLRAAECAAAIGAGPVSTELGRLARRAGIELVQAPDGRTAASEQGARPFGLTPREVEVLALVALGASNADIAERLFISPKTASVHVSNIYSKLGVESRVAAATVAHQLGIVDATDEGGGPGQGRA